MQGSGNRQTLTANGLTTERLYVGPIRLSLSDDFGGGTAKLQAKDPTGTFVDIANGSFTEATDTVFDFPVTSLNVLQVDISGSTTPALVIWIQGKSLSQ